MAYFEIDITLRGTVLVKADNPEDANLKVMHDWTPKQLLSALMDQSYHCQWETDTGDIRER